MYKTYFFLEGEAGVDPFRQEGDAAAQALRAAVPEAAGFTQTRTLSEQIEGRGEPPFVGVAELWFSEKRAALASVEHAQALQPILADGVRVGPIVTGMARTVMRLPAQHAGGFIKGVFPFRRKPGMSVADFQHHWWLNHGPIAALTEQAVYYLQCHPMPETYTPGRPPFDGITELHWSDVPAARASMASRQMVEDQGSDAANFVEPDSVILFLAREEVVIAA